VSPATIQTESLAQELTEAYAQRTLVSTPPSQRDPSFGLAEAYAVEAELVRMRRGAGHVPVGRKVGLANRALWRLHKLSSVVWAHMYDDTVQYTAPGAVATLSISRMLSPKIEPEIIFKLKRTPSGDATDAAAVLQAVASFGLGYEIVDCVYPNWKFAPADFVAAFGFHAALIVGPLQPLQPAAIPELIEQLAECRVRLLCDGAEIATGGGAKVLESPALCLGELAAGIRREVPADPLAAGEIIATGALTDNQFLAPGQRWTAVLDGLALPELTLRTTP
jgi:2-keto-4-pentenoate hydratase